MEEIACYGLQEKLNKLFFYEVNNRQYHLIQRMSEYYVNPFLTLLSYKESAALLSEQISLYYKLNRSHELNTAYLTKLEFVQPKPNYEKVKEKLHGSFEQRACTLWTTGYCTTNSLRKWITNYQKHNLHEEIQHFLQ